MTNLGRQGGVSEADSTGSGASNYRLVEGLEAGKDNLGRPTVYFGHAHPGAMIYFVSFQVSKSNSHEFINLEFPDRFPFKGDHWIELSKRKGFFRGFKVADDACGVYKFYRDSDGNVEYRLVVDRSKDKCRWTSQMYFFVYRASEFITSLVGYQKLDGFKRGRADLCLNLQGGGRAKMKYLKNQDPSEELPDFCDSEKWPDSDFVKDGEPVPRSNFDNEEANLFWIKNIQPEPSSDLGADRDKYLTQSGGTQHVAVYVGPITGSDGDEREHGIPFPSDEVLRSL